MRQQPTLFEKKGQQGKRDDEQLVLYALGDFQSRGKVLAERDLPLDRLRGAFRRAAEAFGLSEFEDERLVRALQALGANVRQVPAFVAKHPFRVIIHIELAERARQVYEKLTGEDETARHTK
jgi:hypothetical protein